MRLIFGLSVPFMLLIAGWLLRDVGQQFMTGGLYVIAGLLTVGSLTGALLRSRWAIPYVACVIACFMVLVVVLESGGLSSVRSEDRSVLVWWIVLYAALGGFAAVGVEQSRRNARKSR